MPEEMPVMAGITHYFDIDSIDFAAGKWRNKVGGGDMTITGSGGTVVDGAARFLAAMYGKIAVPSDSTVKTLYCYFKSEAQLTKYTPIFQKSSNQNDPVGSRYGICVMPDGEIFYNGNGNDTVGHLIHGGATTVDYHVVVLTRDARETVYMYIDGALCGAAEKYADQNTYAGSYCLNRYEKNGAAYGSYFPANILYKMAAVGSQYHDPQQVYTNSVYLMTGKVPSGEGGGVGINAPAIAWCISRNIIERSSFLRAIEAYRQGIIDSPEKTDRDDIPSEPIPPEPIGGVLPVTFQDNSEIGSYTDPIGKTGIGRGTGGSIINFNPDHGLWLQGSTGEYYHIYIDMSVEIRRGSFTRAKGAVVKVTYNSSGAFVRREENRLGNWGWRGWSSYSLPEYMDWYVYQMYIEGEYLRFRGANIDRNGAIVTTTSFSTFNVSGCTASTIKPSLIQ